MNKAILNQDDKLTIELDSEEFTVKAWSDNLKLEENSIMVINNTLCCTGSITKINDNHYKVNCFYQDALIVQDKYFWGNQSEID